MGCSQSQPAVVDPPVAVAPPQSRKPKKKKSTTTSTRQRADSWAVAVTNPLEQQWRLLWEALSPELIDPVDVHSVLDSLMSRHMNKLGPTEILWIQRKIRASNSSKPTRFSGSTHLLTEAVVRKFFRNPLDNVYTLLLHFQHWDRVADVATEATAYLDMDVNHQAVWTMPKPSKVHDVDPLVDTPKGVTLSSLACLLGLAWHGTRSQKLQLLFYLCLPDLDHFLRTHPAGGVPIWLLEVDEGTVVSLASLTHYHYYGHTYLPKPVPQKQAFVGSKSRAPVRVLGSSVQQIVNGALESSSVSHTTQTSLTERLHELAEHGGDCPSVRVRSVSLDHEHWTLEDFDKWASQALDDEALDAVMHQLLGVGIVPHHITERDLVQARWEEWQSTIGNLNPQPEGTLELMTRSFQALLETCQNGNGSKHQKSFPTAWGYIGGIDGGGGLGQGVLYCVDKKWWDHWTAYTAWNWVDERPKKRANLARPGPLSNQALLDLTADAYSPGMNGSYELMKQDLERDRDYVLVPPGVWDMLYELYGGGPPLPRMIGPPSRKSSNRARLGSHHSASRETKDIHTNGTSSGGHAVQIPSAVSVQLHPWTIHCQLCDPSQPYRRGDLGSTSIRIMAVPDQPLWRLFMEAVARFPLHSYKAHGPDGYGMARLWKKITVSNPKDPILRYGAWSLVCKNRTARIPPLDNGLSVDEYREIFREWDDYACQSTVDGIGIVDGDHLMLEFATIGKNGDLAWPRQAAADAGHQKRIQEEDNKFKRTLQGVDAQGNVMIKPPSLLGMDIDAMDATGKWFLVTILEVQIMDDDSDEEQEEDEDGNVVRSNGNKVLKARKKVRVTFEEFGGHQDWIDVESDRLAVKGRFTNSDKSGDAGVGNNSTHSSQADKSKSSTVVKKPTNGEAEGGKICLLPGFGACGLSNMGNTCYMNSAIQCIGYMPLLRAYVLSDQFKTAGDLNKDNPLGTGGKLLEEFAVLLRSLWSAKFGEKTPTRFRTQLGKINVQFHGADQQDAQEFLSYILDALHEDSNKVRQKPYVEALEDSWVAKNPLSRVGEESWRRFLRRNRSVMADTSMGQTLNTVTCQTCKHTSQSFDPFNLLSIPIPTVENVVFQCTVYRKSTAFNCPWVLNKPRKDDERSRRFSRRQSHIASDSPETHVAETFAITISRLTDSSDLKAHVERLSGIAASQLKLCRVEEVTAEDVSPTSVVKKQVRVTPLTDKEGPCSQLERTARAANNDSKGPVQLVAFASTLNVRTKSRKSTDSTDGPFDEDTDETKSDDLEISDAERRKVEEHMETYGDEKECRIFDSDPLVPSIAISRSLWPRSPKEWKLGLRVDAKDSRGNWYPGSVVEILEAKENGSEEPKKGRQVHVHFDNFSSKWDELYDVNDFREGNIHPLYSMTEPRMKPTEFVVHHRFTNRDSGSVCGFGESFFVHCHHEWSNARAGAQILAQASRFLEFRPEKGGPIDTDDPSALEREAKARRLYDKTHNAISDLIDLLVEADREYMQAALGFNDPSVRFRNPAFDVTEMSSGLVKKVAALLHRLPFEVRVCTIDNTPEQKATDEFLFPFSLVRTIGNFMNARHVVILQWRQPPKRSGESYLDDPVLYIPPPVHMDDTHAQVLKKLEDSMPTKKPDSLPLGDCLTEFCKSQVLQHWRCPKCRDERQGKQHMSLWRLPDLLTFHVKRFNMSARWREKITTKVQFPMTGLDLGQWCHAEAESQDVVYDLIGVMNHYGSMTGGHYVASIRASPCSKDGREEVAYPFPGVRVDSMDDTNTNTGWRLPGGRSKSDLSTPGKAAAKAAAESAEPLWLQFDDELVEAIPPEQVVSETAYVLFYRRRHLQPSNVAKYCTLE